MRKIKGQSVLEYVIVLTAIVAAILVGAVALTRQNSTSGLGKLMNKAGGTIDKAATDIGAISP